MKLSEKRVLFTRLLCRLVLESAYDLAFGEGYVALTDAADGDYDGPHKKGGGHYSGLGIDLLLYDNGVYVTGDHPAWQDIGPRWEAMNPLCRWGARFGDPNHFSLEHEGRA